MSRAEIIIDVVANITHALKQRHQVTLNAVGLDFESILDDGDDWDESDQAQPKEATREECSGYR